MRTVEEEKKTETPPEVEGETCFLVSGKDFSYVILLVFALI